MNYELAKKLKDVGFPLKDGPSLVFVKEPQDDAEEWFEYPLGEVHWKPTLSELIEACGKCFIALKQQSTPKGFPFMWAAYGRYEKDVVEYSTTPEEAVANLWLALNK